MKRAALEEVWKRFNSHSAAPNGDNVQYYTRSPHPDINQGITRDREVRPCVRTETPLYRVTSYGFSANTTANETNCSFCKEDL
ncbi:hypothetical protein NQZ68_028143 [Dissostichus eleginoides]|nr:hypothetical protein NQZ68_028143 [Dissostichus eleginoides]